MTKLDSIDRKILHVLQRDAAVQVSDLADFSNLLDNKVVDQRSYTPYDRTYPEQPLFWRVQAIDGS